MDGHIEALNRRRAAVKEEMKIARAQRDPDKLKHLKVRNLQLKDAISRRRTMVH